MSCILSSFDVDLLPLLLEHISVIEKLALATTSTSFRVLLSPFFEEWDREFGEAVCEQIDATFPDKGYVMHRSTGRFLSHESRLQFRPTTKTMEDPLFHVVKNTASCHAFEHGFFEAAKVGCKHEAIKSLSLSNAYPGKELVEAVPLIEAEGCEFAPIYSLSRLKNAKVEWEFHPDKEEWGVGHFFGGADTCLEDKVLFVRYHSLVSANVTFPNPRVGIEVMGTAHLRRWHFNAHTNTFGKRGHINYSHLRLYVSKPTLTSTMKKRAARRASLRPRRTPLA